MCIVDIPGTSEKALLIAFKLKGHEYDKDEFRVRLVITEDGQIYAENYHYEQIMPINTIPIIDYLREEKIILD